MDTSRHWRPQSAAMRQDRTNGEEAKHVMCRRAYTSAEQTAKAARGEEAAKRPYVNHCAGWRSDATKSSIAPQ